jgi:predicted protein tyrosine phosphatase
VLAGEYPGPQRRDRSLDKLCGLLRAGVRHFVDLTQAHEANPPYDTLAHAEATALGVTITHERHPIVDLGVPSTQTMRAVLAALRSHRTSVTYLHCWGGIGRTGTAAGCLLVELGLDGQQALEALSTKWQAMAKHTIWPRSPQTEAQIDFVRRWERG